MKQLNLSEQILAQIDSAAKVISNGGLVAFPTETVYGLGANALDPIAVSKIFELKGRPKFDPLIVHIADINDVKLLSSSNESRIYQLAKIFWPGPLTIVVPKSPVVPDIVTAGLQTVGIRMPNNSIALELIKKSRCPIAAPSANKFGKISPTTAEHVKKYFPKIDFILDGGKTEIGIESTVIKLNEKGFEILRHGVITREEIETIIPYHSEENNSVISAPGMIKSHYSPNKPFYILNEKIKNKIDRSKAGLISFSGNDTEGFKRVVYLSKKKDLSEAAENLFGAMHQLEESDVEIIVAETVPEKGIGIAIMDRLKKAAYKNQNDINKTKY
jgi:L-threonylcarbamoyladenylate synthase